MQNPIRDAISYAAQTDSTAAYVLHVTLSDGRTITGSTHQKAEDGIGVESPDGCTFVHFLNPAHILFVRLEWV